MQDQMQARDDRPVGGSRAARLYETPTLTTIGNLEQITQNDPGPSDDGETTDFIIATFS